MSTWAEIRARHDAAVVRTRTANEEIGLASSERFVAMQHRGLLLRVQLAAADEARELELAGWSIKAHDTERQARATYDKIERFLVAGAMSVVSTDDGLVALVP